MNFPDGSKSKKEYLVKNFGTDPMVHAALVRAYKLEADRPITLDYLKDVDWSQVNITNLILYAEKSVPSHKRFLTLYLEHMAVQAMVQLNGG